MRELGYTSLFLVDVNLKKYMIESFLNFAQANSQWAAVFVFLIAFAESLVIVGLFLPGWLLLVGFGSMIGADVLGFYPIVIAAYFGAVLGEYFSFYLGFRYHERILNWPVFIKQKKLFDYSHRFFENYGVIGVFVGRFFGPARAVIPFIAGVSEMNKRTFFWVNTISGLLWAPAYLFPGILIGAAVSIESEKANTLALILVLIGVALMMAVNLGKKYLLTQSEHRTGLGLFQWILSLMICCVSLMIFIDSPYWEVFVQMLLILGAKL